MKKVVIEITVPEEKALDIRDEIADVIDETHRITTIVIKHTENPKVTIQDADDS